MGARQRVNWKTLDGDEVEQANRFADLLLTESNRVSRNRKRISGTYWSARFQNFIFEAVHLLRSYPPW